jgi:hypothetical protein
MRYQVPQFIDVEDKIIGPLSLKQFFFLAGGGALVLMFFFLFKLAYAIMLSIPVIAISASLAFIKIGGMPLLRYISSVVGFAFKPQEYHWKKKEDKNLENNT